MRILKNLFGGESTEQSQAKIKWISLTEIHQLDEIIKSSNTKYQAIFKHSTRCGVSSSVLRQFERQDNTSEIDFYFLDLLRLRMISDEISKRFGIIHESPQLIVVKNEEVVAYASHSDILKMELA